MKILHKKLTFYGGLIGLLMPHFCLESSRPEPAHVQRPQETVINYKYQNSKMNEPLENYMKALRENNKKQQFAVSLDKMPPDVLANYTLTRINQENKPAVSVNDMNINLSPVVKKQGGFGDTFMNFTNGLGLLNRKFAETGSIIVSPQAKELMSDSQHIFEFNMGDYTQLLQKKLPNIPDKLLQIMVRDYFDSLVQKKVGTGVDPENFVKRFDNNFADLSVAPTTFSLLGMVAPEPANLARTLKAMQTTYEANAATKGFLQLADPVQQNNITDLQLGQPIGGSSKKSINLAKSTSEQAVDSSLTRVKSSREVDASNLQQVSGATDLALSAKSSRAALSMLYLML